MAASPVSVLAVVMLTLTFNALLIGEELAEASFESFSLEGESNNPFIPDFLEDIGDALTAVVKAAWGAVTFFFGLITFNVDKAPWFVRVPVGSILGGGLFWSIATLIRGN